MKVLDLFSGIGGFSLGLEAAGMETIAFCEIEKYPQKVLAKHWPDVPIATDVTKLTYKEGVLYDDGKEIYRGSIDVICGGFPCQDISIATKVQDGYTRGKGIEGERSGLWSECARLAREIRPKYCLFENVSNLINGGEGNWFRKVLWDITQAGYDAEWSCIRASDLGAWHHRERVFILCYPMRERLERYREFGGFNQGIQQKRQPIISLASKSRESVRNWSGKPAVCRVVDGLSDRSHRIKALGNSLVPQIPEIIGKAIMESNL